MQDVQNTDDRGQTSPLIGIRPARIVEIREDELRSDYSWYTSWTTGCESIYALLSKFALLNCLPAREIASLFISRRCGRKTVLVERLDLDLREPELFDLPIIAKLCCTTEPAVTAGFVRPKYAHSLRETCPELRYCPQCLECGFHSALFQLTFIARCPIHHVALKQRCERCAGMIPYRLLPSVVQKPFLCPHCEACFAPALRAGPRQALRLSAETRSVLEHASEVACAKSQLLGGAQPLEKHFAFFGRGRLVLSARSIQRSQAEYEEFIDALLLHASGGLQESRLRASTKGDVEPGASVIQIVRGHDLPRPRIQQWRFARVAGRVRSDKGARRVPIGRKNPRKSRPLSLGSMPLTARNAGAECPTMDKVSGALRECGWDGKYAEDGKLEAIYPVYQGIRRHLFRHPLSAHQDCIRSAAMRMGRDVEGELIARFCPVAEAFLRWRMFWEGFGVPADLYRRPRHPAYGVLAWLCDGAPIGAQGWTTQGEQWLTHRVFAMQCLRNFYQWLSHCESAEDDRPQRWRRADVIGSCLTYWAAAGNDTPLHPLRVFIDTSFRRTVASPVEPSPAEHRVWHHGQLLRMHSARSGERHG